MIRHFNRWMARLGVAASWLLLASQVSHARDIWTPQQANAWYARQPWLLGSNYTPASAINQLEMWQAATFDPERIDRELGWAEGIGMNVMRVFLHDLLWQQDVEGFKGRMGQFLGIAAKHHIRILFVLFDSCWEPEPRLGPQHPPIPGVHNSGWTQSPGLPALRDLAQERRLEAYVKGVVGAFAKDDRVIGWDVWNEPAAELPKDLERVQVLLPHVFAWARSVNPSQPLTSGLFQEASFSDHPPAIDRIQLRESDVISFHDYSWPETFHKKVMWLSKLGRPVWCTEYLARGVGSTFEGSLPIGKRHNVAMINWGLVDGKTQTRFPWDSWTIPYLKGRDPIVWHHDVFRSDGTPYRRDEVELIRAIAHAPKGAVPDAETLEILASAQP